MLQAKFFITIKYTGSNPSSSTKNKPTVSLSNEGPLFLCISKPVRRPNKTCFSKLVIVLTINLESYDRKKKDPLAPPEFDDEPSPLFLFDLKIYSLFVNGSREFMISNSKIPLKFLNL
jgi:hypothetical protein